ncbi:MAG: hypothetical protein WA864_12635, partial [Acetobacteraceae bacterium]
FSTMVVPNPRQRGGWSFWCCDAIIAGRRRPASHVFHLMRAAQSAHGFSLAAKRRSNSGQKFALSNEIASQ